VVELIGERIQVLGLKPPPAPPSLHEIEPEGATEAVPVASFAVKKKVILAPALVVPGLGARVAVTDRRSTESNDLPVPMACVTSPA
jgi:hypothetical protein